MSSVKAHSLPFKKKKKKKKKKKNTEKKVFYALFRKTKHKFYQLKKKNGFIEYCELFLTVFIFKF